MNVEIGTEAPIFLFWEYLFQIFGILSLQCRKGINTLNEYQKSVMLFLTEKVLFYAVNQVIIA
jgi:hypothetical protein